MKKGNSPRWVSVDGCEVLTSCAVQRVVQRGKKHNFVESNQRPTLANWNETVLKVGTTWRPTLDEISKDTPMPSAEALAAR